MRETTAPKPRARAVWQGRFREEPLWVSERRGDQECTCEEGNKTRSVVTTILLLRWPTGADLRVTSLIPRAVVGFLYV